MMKESSVVVPEEIPAIGIVYNSELPCKKTLVLQTHVAQTASQKEIDTLVDKLKATADRQYAQEHLVILRLELEQQEKIASDHLARMTQVDMNIKAAWHTRGKKGDPTLDKREQEEQSKAHFHLEECKRRIAKVKGQIAENEAIVAGTAAPMAAGA